MSAIVWWLAHSSVLPFLGIGMRIDLFQSCGHCWVFQICWHIEFEVYVSVKYMLEFKDVIGNKQNVKLCVKMVIFWLHRDKLNLLLKFAPPVSFFKMWNHGSRKGLYFGVLFLKLFVYFFVVMGFHCCARAFSSCGGGGCSSLRCAGFYCCGFSCAKHRP